MALAGEHAGKGEARRHASTDCGSRRTNPGGIGRGGVL